MVKPTFSSDDLAYLNENYCTLEVICQGRRETPDTARRLITAGLLPRPSYVLDDGTELFPADYFRLPDDAGGPERLRAHFAERYYAAGGRAEEFESQWDGYMSGTYGVCLRDVIPETMVRKSALVDSLSDLLSNPRPDDGQWQTRLQREVEELDALEREFSPDYDRSDRFEELPSRDRLIAVAHERYAQVFAKRTPAGLTAVSPSASTVGGSERRSNHGADDHDEPKG